MLSTLLLSYFLGLCFASEVVLPQALVNVSDLLNTSIKEAALRTNTSVDVRPRLTRREAVNAQVPSALLKDGLLNTANATAKRIAVRFDAQGGFASTAFSKQAEGVKLAVKRGNESAPHQGHMLAKEPAQSAQPPQQLLQEPQQLQQQVSLKAQQLQQLQRELQELQKRQDMERMQQEPPVEHSQQPDSGPGQLQQPPAELSQVVGGSKQAIGSGGALNATEQLAQPQPQQHVQDLLEQQSPLSPFFSKHQDQTNDSTFASDANANNSRSHSSIGDVASRGDVHGVVAQATPPMGEVDNKSDIGSDWTDLGDPVVPVQGAAQQKIMRKASRPTAAAKPEKSVMPVGSKDDNKTKVENAHMVDAKAAQPRNERNAHDPFGTASNLTDPSSIQDEAVSEKGNTVDSNAVLKSARVEPSTARVERQPEKSTADPGGHKDDGATAVKVSRHAADADQLQEPQVIGPKSNAPARAGDNSTGNGSPPSARGNPPGNSGREHMTNSRPARRHADEDEDVEQTPNKTPAKGEDQPEHMPRGRKQPARGDNEPKHMPGRSPAENEPIDDDTASPKEVQRQIQEIKKNSEKSKGAPSEPEDYEDDEGVMDDGNTITHRRRLHWRKAPNGTPLAPPPLQDSADKIGSDVKSQSTPNSHVANAPSPPPPIGPFSAGSPLVRRDLPTIVDNLPAAGAVGGAPLQPLSPSGNAAGDWPLQPTDAPLKDGVDTNKNAPSEEEPRNAGSPVVDDSNDDPAIEPVEEADEAEAQEEETQTVISVGEPLKAPSKDTWHVPDESDVLRLGEGVGSLAYDRSPTSSRTLNKELRRRLELQDCATIALLVAVFAVTIFVSCYGIYQVAEDPSPVLFYSDPRYFQRRLTCPSADVEAFMRAFNGQPQNARLRIIGKRSNEESLGNLIYQGRFSDAHQQLRHRARDFMAYSGFIRARQRPWDAVVFDVSLDLTPFISGEGRLTTADDVITLQKYLGTPDAMEVVLLQKKVEWPSWEDVATNIRQRLRTLGFTGEVEVLFEAKEEVLIYRNHPWQNFIRSRITQALVLISVVGGFVWLPYLWWRTKKIKVSATFQISLDLQRYWELFSDGLHPIEGFVGA